MKNVVHQADERQKLVDGHEKCRSSILGIQHKQNNKQI
jgi:hypothetical protein